MSKKVSFFPLNGPKWIKGIHSGHFPSFPLKRKWIASFFSGKIEWGVDFICICLHTHALTSLPHRYNPTVQKRKHNAMHSPLFCGKGMYVHCTLHRSLCLHFYLSDWENSIPWVESPTSLSPHKYRRGNKISKLIKHLQEKPSLSLGETRVGDTYFFHFYSKKIYTTTLFVLNQSVFDDDAFSSSTFFSSISCSSFWNLRKKL